MDNQAKNRQWYAIRVTYSREMIVKEALDKRGVECFVAMHNVERMAAGRKRKLWEPVIHNLVFIHATAECLRELKAFTTLPIYYIMDRAAGIPLVIPDRQMEDFIRVASAQDGRSEIIDTQEASLICGDHVRIKEGPFAGVEGRYIRHKGHYKVAVEIHGIATALTAYIPSRSVEKIETAAPATRKAAGSRAASDN